MTKRELEQRITDLEAQVRMLSAQVAQQRVVQTPYYPYQQYPFTYPIITCGGSISSDPGPQSYNLPA